MLKILQVRLQQYVNCELPDVQAGLKAEKPEIKLPTSTGSWQFDLWFLCLLKPGGTSGSSQFTYC